ncbi:MAG: hypothetical protein IPK19_35720 [Chloroflexi bacterium]|nr:hypothetical protein [Chloroflexota bacterium]
MTLSSRGLFDLIFYGLFFFISAMLLLRYGLIAAGMFKGPVLSIYARYEPDDMYYALPLALLAVALFVLTGSLLLSLFVPLAARGAILGALIALLSYVAYFMRFKARERPDIYSPVPLWAVRLRQRTTREERRRIAFLWLRLPWRTRIRYDVSDHHFEMWCDLVILGTITQTMNDASVEAAGQRVAHDMDDRLYP